MLTTDEQYIEMFKDCIIKLRLLMWYQNHPSQHFDSVTVECNVQSWSKKIYNIFRVYFKDGM